MLQQDAVSMIVPGRYFWELLFSFENTGNGPIVETRKVTRTRTVNSRQFLSNTFKISSGFSFKNKSSISLSFEGLADGSTESEYSFHVELADELVKTSETSTIIE